MDIKWVFLNNDGSKDQATINEPNVPSPGDGKLNNGKGYVVRHVVDGRTTGPEPIAIATEHHKSAKSHA